MWRNILIPSYSWCDGLVNLIDKERNAAAWVSQVKVAARTAQREGCGTEEMMNNAINMAQAKREEEAAERARREAEEKARREAEEKARREAEEMARREAEEKARREAEEKARRDAEEKARRDSMEKIPTEGNKSPGHADQKGEEMIRGEDPVEKSDLPGEKAQVARQSLFSEHKKDEEKNRSDSRAETDSRKTVEVQAEKQQEVPPLVSDALRRIITWHYLTITMTIPLHYIPPQYHSIRRFVNFQISFFLQHLPGCWSREASCEVRSMPKGQYFASDVSSDQFTLGIFAVYFKGWQILPSYISRLLHKPLK